MTDDGICCAKHRRLAEEAEKSLGGKDTDPLHIVGEFAESRLAFSTSAWTPSRDLYDAYVSFCEESGYRPEAINRFPSYLVKMFPFLSTRQRNTNGICLKGYVGVSLRDDG